jgi:hypothetical protein
MSSDFWARKIGGIAQPRQQLPPPGPALGAPRGAWWQDEQPQQQYPPQQQYGYPQEMAPGYNPALAAQMPGQYAPGTRVASDGRVVDDNYIRQLRKVQNAAETLTPEQMELIAEWELENEAKYNSVCPQCGSGNFAPAGTKNAHGRLGSDKCFDCGASSSTYTASPEPARGGGNGKAAWRDVRQIDTGGGAGPSMYLKFQHTPAGYVPRP